MVVEDIVDSGVTLHYLMQVFAQRRPKSLRVATLLDKPEHRQRPVDVDYVGFKIPDEFRRVGLRARTTRRTTGT